MTTLDCNIQMAGPTARQQPSATTDGAIFLGKGLSLFRKTQTYSRNSYWWTTSMNKPLITLTSDFGVQSQSVGVMEAVARNIAPEANIVHLMHGLPSFDIIAAARTLETIHTIQIGIHVC